MPTQLEGAMDTLIKVFHHYSAKEGDKYKLNKGELKQLLTSELTDFLSVRKSHSILFAYYLMGRRTVGGGIAFEDP